MSGADMVYAGKWIAGVFAGLFVVVAIVLASLIVFGTAARPPELRSVSDPMRGIGFADLPAPQAFTARDGQVLHYRLYPGRGRDVVVLIHGSSGESSGMHAVAKALRAAGDTVYVPDLRGHGHDGRPGDIAYAGQLQDDLADLVGVIRRARRDADISLVGHSSGGGFVLRVSEGPDAHLFNRFVLLSPLFPYGAATYRPQLGSWAVPFTGRIIALEILNGFGVHAFDGLPIVAFAVDPHATVPLVSAYSFRMQREFSAPADALPQLAGVTQPVVVLIGKNDELFYAGRFAPLIQRERPDTPVIVVPGVDHMGMVTTPVALDAVVAAVQRAQHAAALPRNGALPSAQTTDASPNILAQTPWWVFAVFAILLVTGVQALRPRIVPVWRLLIVPLVFIVWGVISISMRAAAMPALIFWWIAAIAAGVGLGLATTRLRGFVFERGRGLVRVPGSPLPLVRNASIFAVRYGLAVAAAFAPVGTLHLKIVVCDVAISGLATGYFLGWAVRFAGARRATNVIPASPQEAARSESIA